jgi:hypothetical protein
VKNIPIFLFFLLTLSICFPCRGNDTKELFLKKIQNGIPVWMRDQVDMDLAAFRKEPVSLKKIYEYYDTSSPDLYLIKFTICQNHVFTECKTNSPGLQYRCDAYIQALKLISEVIDLPDAVFLISMHDSFSPPPGVPVFSMCKEQQNPWAILLPDFEALRGKFQVLPNKDLISFEPPWNLKKNQLIWRGSTAQCSLDGELMREDNVDRFSRVILCKLSQQYPHLIDAKFTFFAQGGELVSSLKSFQSKQMPFEWLIQYKYQLFIDGNVSPYSASGWKFFINSLIFKPDSIFIQWYFGGLKPYEHYVPVKNDLADLIEKIIWARSNDAEACRMAKNVREFALSHITLPDNLLFLYYAILQYSCLTFL